MGQEVTPPELRMVRCIRLGLRMGSRGLASTKTCPLWPSAGWGWLAEPGVGAGGALASLWLLRLFCQDQETPASPQYSLSLCGHNASRLHGCV